VVKLAFRLDVSKSGPLPVPTVDVFCTMRALYSCRVEQPDIVSHVCGVIAAGNGNVRVCMANCIDDEGRRRLRVFCGTWQGVN